MGLSEDSLADVPDGYTCPISREIMEDPVLLFATGHSFERNCIEKWLLHHSVCPVTNKEVEDSSALITNWNLKKAIEEWMVKANTAQKQLPTYKDMKLVDLLGASPASTTISISGKDAARVTCLLESESEDAIGVAAGALHRLLSGRRAAANLARLSEAGAFRAVGQVLHFESEHPLEGIPTKLVERLHAFIDRALPPLLASFSRGKALNSFKTPSTPRDWESSALALQGLTVDKKSCARIVAAGGAGVLWRLLEVLASGMPPAKQHAAAALGNLAAGGQLLAAGLVGEGVLRVLADALRDRAPGVQEAAARALSKLAVDEDSRRKLGGIRGAVEVAGKLLRSPVRGVREASAEVVGSLARVRDIAVKLSAMGLFGPLARLLKEGNSRAQKAAAEALGSILHSPLPEEDILSPDVLGPMVGVLRDGDPDAKAAVADALCMIANGREATARIIEEKALRPLAKLLEEGTVWGKSSAASALDCIFQEGAKGDPELEQLIEEGVMDSLALLLMEGVREGLLCAKEAALEAWLSLTNYQKVEEADAGVLRPLVAVLLGEEAPEIVRLAAKVVQNLASSAEIGDELVGEGVVPPLIRLLLQEPASPAQASAAAALGNLALEAAVVRTAMRDEGCLGPVMKLLEHGDEEEKESASMALAGLAEDPDSRADIAQYELEPLVSLLADHTAAAIYAVNAVNELMLDPGARAKLLAGGVLGPLVELLGARRSFQKVTSAEALEKLAEDDSSKDFMIQAGAIPLLEKMMLDEYDLIRARPLLALLRATLDEASAGTQRAI